MAASRPQFYAAAALGALSALTACAGDTTSAATTTTVQAGGPPQRAKAIEPCLMTLDDVAKALGRTPDAPGEGTEESCSYVFNSSAGESRLQLRIRPYVTDPVALKAAKQNHPSCTPVEVPKVGEGMIMFEPDANFNDVPAYLLTSRGMVQILYFPAGGATDKDSKAVVTLSKAIDKKISALPD